MRRTSASGRKRTFDGVPPVQSEFNEPVESSRGMIVDPIALSKSAVGLAFMLLPVFSSAHHSRVDFDTSSVVELEGELIDVTWRNPHPVFAVRTSNPSGDEQLWDIEASGIYVLERSGINGDEFPIGEHVRVAGWQSRLNPSGLYITNMLLPNGAELVLRPGGERRWSDVYSGGDWIYHAANDDSRGLFRVWSTESYDVFIQASLGIEVQLTEEARATMAESAALDPCVPQGMPAIMVNPLPIEFVDRGDHIDLQLATFGVFRSIDMTDNANVDSVSATKQGYSSGRWMGDTLEVNTTRVSWPYFDDAGTPQTETVQILETFTPSDDGIRLDYTMIVSDAASFIEPVTLSWYWIDIGEQMFLDDTCPDAN